MSIILSALNYLAIAKIKDADIFIKPFSVFGADWLISKTGDRKMDLDRYNPYDKILKRIEASKLIDPETAQLFLSTMSEGKIPQWGLLLAKPYIETIKLSAEQ